MMPNLGDGHQKNNVKTERLGNILTWLVAILYGGGILCVFLREIFGPRAWSGQFDAALLLPMATGFLLEGVVGKEFTWAKTHRQMPMWLGRLFCLAVAASLCLRHGTFGTSDPRLKESAPASNLSEDET